MSTQRASTSIHVGANAASALANARTHAGSWGEHGNIGTGSVKFAQVLGEISSEHRTLTTNGHAAASTGTRAETGGTPPVFPRKPQS